MKQKFLNAKMNNREVVQPDIQEMAVNNVYAEPNAGELPGGSGEFDPFRNFNGAKTGGFTNPGEERPYNQDADPQRDIDSMSDEDFADYINSAQEGRIGEVQAENAGESKRQIDGVQKTDEENIGQPDTEIPADSGIAEPAGTAKPFRTFATQADYQTEINRIMGERLRKNREGMEKLEGLKQLALNLYGGFDGDFALLKLTEELKNRAAGQKGMNVNNYGMYAKERPDAEQYREMERRRRERQQRSQDIYTRWMRESEDLKAIVPDFDFNKAMDNGTFHDCISRGMSVGAAYIASTRNNPALQQPDTKRRSIPQNGSMSRNGVGKVEMNVNNMSDAEFQKYINKIRG